MLSFMHLSQCFPAVTTSLSLFTYFKFLPLRLFAHTVIHLHLRFPIPLIPPSPPSHPHSHLFLSSLHHSHPSPFLPLAPSPFRALFNILPKATSVDLIQCYPRTCRTVALMGGRPLTGVSKRYVRSFEHTVLPFLHCCSTPPVLFLSCCLLYFFLLLVDSHLTFHQTNYTRTNTNVKSRPKSKPKPKYASSPSSSSSSSSTTLSFRFRSIISWNRNPRKSPHSLTWDFLKNSPRQH
jgi:hypothetical protein